MDTGWRRNYLRYKSFFLNMMTQYKERSDWKVYLEILLSLVTVSIFSVFALRPTILTIAELIKQIEEKKSTVAQMDKKIQDLGKAQTLVDRESANIFLLTETVIPKTPNSDIFSRQLEALSSKHQVPITNFRLGEAVIKGVSKETTESEDETNEESIELENEFNKMEFSINTPISVEQYESLLSFLRDFENLRMPSKIDTLEVSVSNEEDVANRNLILILEGELPYLQSINEK